MNKMASKPSSLRIDPKAKDVLDKLALYTGMEKSKIVSDAILEFVQKHFSELLSEDSKKLIEEKIKKDINEAIQRKETKKAKRGIIDSFIGLLKLDLKYTECLIKGDNFDLTSGLFNIIKQASQSILRRAIWKEKYNIAYIIQKSYIKDWFLIYNFSDKIRPYDLRYSIAEKLITEEDTPLIEQIKKEKSASGWYLEEDLKVEALYRKYDEALLRKVWTKMEEKRRKYVHELFEYLVNLLREKPDISIEEFYSKYDEFVETKKKELMEFACNEITKAT